MYFFLGWCQIGQFWVDQSNTKLGNIFLSLSQHSSFSLPSHYHKKGETPGEEGWLITNGLKLYRLLSACWWEGSSTAQVRGGNCVSWKCLAASLTFQEWKARGNDMLYLFLLDLWGNSAAFLVSTLQWRHWRMREVRVLGVPGLLTQGSGLFKSPAPATFCDLHNLSTFARTDKVLIFWRRWRVASGCLEGKRSSVGWDPGERGWPRSLEIWTGTLLNYWACITVISLGRERGTSLGHRCGMEIISFKNRAV